MRIMIMPYFDQTYIEKAFLTELLFNILILAAALFFKDGKAPYRNDR